MATATKPPAAKTQGLEVPPIEIGSMAVTLIGESRLVTNRFNEKAISEILDKQMGKAKTGRAKKDPVDCFRRALYVIDGPVRVDGEFTPESVVFRDPTPKDEKEIYGKDAEYDPKSREFLENIAEHLEEKPVRAFGKFGFPAIGLKAACVRAATDAQLRMTDMRRAFFLPGELIEIEAAYAQMRLDMVRVGNGTADVRFRPEFVDWKAKVKIDFNRGVISPTQIVNLLRLAGFGVGLGEWRAEKGGSWGRFRIDPHIEDLGTAEA